MRTYVLSGTPYEFTSELILGLERRWRHHRYIAQFSQRLSGAPCVVDPRGGAEERDRRNHPAVARIRAVIARDAKAERFGWVFNPTTLRHREGQQRPTVEWAGKMVSRIGEAARIVVRGGAGDGTAKFASAHDLRRSCAERIVSAGVQERDVARVLRHASVETIRKYYAAGSTQQRAGVIREKLAVPRYIEAVELT
jgi:integrase